MEVRERESLQCEEHEEASVKTGAIRMDKK